MPKRRVNQPSTEAASCVKADGTGNISKLRREELIGKISEIRTYLENSGDKNAARLVTFAADLEKEVRQKKYGLVFEQHKERVDVELEKNLPVLTENRSRFIDNGGDVNFLIEGDNLAALKLLEKTHRGKIDVIYIDPPYNTGNEDFTYNDSIVGTDDTFRHSKWLSFMEKRIALAKKLLASNGVIFISIDNHEFAQLKFLCDDVFGESNFVEVLKWKRKKQPSFLSRHTASVMEYVVVYAKSYFCLEKLSIEGASDATKKVINISNQECERHFAKGVRVKLEGTGIINAGTYKIKTMSVTYKQDVCYKDGKTLNQVDVVARFSESQERIDSFIKKDLLFITANKGLRRDVSEEEVGRRKSITDLLLDWGDNQDSEKEQQEIFGSRVFDYAKPTKLIENIVKSFNSSASMVLDFFAGSGTTGHAVMKLNAEDGGKRKFILVTNNENDICEKVTYERLKRVIKKEDYKARLKYFKIDYVPIEKQVYFDYADELLKHIRELVELENAIDFNKDDTIAITVTDDEFEKFVTSEKKMSGKKAVYVGHDVLIGMKAKQLLKQKGIEIKIIPEYYYAEQEG